MKRLIVLIVGLLLCGLLPCVGVLHAADVHLEWDVAANAAGYKIYMSIDNGQTWDDGMDVGNVTDFVYPNVPDAGRVLFRASAYNSHGEAIRYTAGSWYCGDCTPPYKPSGLGVE